LFGRALDEVRGAFGLFTGNPEAQIDSATFEIVFAPAMVDQYKKVIKPRVDAVAIPIFSVAFPWERGVAPKVGNKGPRYPVSAREAGAQGTVIMQFLVDSAGHVVESSIRDLWPRDKPQLTGELGKHYRSFVDAVRDIVPRLAFEPAVIGGCSTAQLVQMPFQFTLNR
jgi:hypothetical protein